MDDAASLDLAIRVARHAGGLAAERLGAPGYLSWKGQRDVVSGSIVEVQDAIVAGLRAERPDDAILVEEGPEDEPLDLDRDRLWIVDPICGSLNFVHGIPFFAISIALREGRRPTVGVVHDPMRNETFWARFGEPAFLNDRPITVLNTALGPEFWEEAWVGTDLPPSGPRRDLALRAFRFFSDEVTVQTVMGSPALGMCYVAAGRLHAYWNLDAKPWDVAAASVVLSQAGALVTDAEGGSWLHSDGGYLAANPASHTWALRGLKYVLGQTEPKRA